LPSRLRMDRRALNLYPFYPFKIENNWAEALKR
jgi:hypothetical protein